LDGLKWEVIRTTLSCVRYLTRAFALGALRRGRQIEQFIGPVDVAGDVAAIRWVLVCKGQHGYEAWSYDVEDLDDDGFLDLMEFPPVGSPHDEEPGARYLGCTEDEEASLLLVEESVGASPDRWVNEGVAGEDYADFVRARPAVPPAARPRAVVDRCYPIYRARHGHAAAPLATVRISADYPPLPDHRWKA
jgi:hypothetical protein